MKRTSVFLAMLCQIAGLAFAQQRTGNIYGKVVDENQSGIPGVKLTLMGDLIGQMTAVSDERGNFRFLSLSPGMYEIKAELRDFAVVIQKNIKVVCFQCLIQLYGNRTRIFSLITDEYFSGAS